MKGIEVVKVGQFNDVNHWYPKALNATIHPMVSFFLNLDKKRIINRYIHLNPSTNKDELERVLSYKPKYFQWSGADLINSTSSTGIKKMILIENNSSPSGQKSMPLLDDNKEEGGYRLLIEESFKEFLKTKKNMKKTNGKLAVFYDKNYMEASGYARSMANVFNETTYLVPYFLGESNDHIKINDDYIYILTPDEGWQPLRATFRYLTQKPWNRLPIHSKTVIFNPIIACLSGGRNKMMASKAYDLYNSELLSLGLNINTPETIWDVSKEEIPLWVKKMGGYAVIKIPYSNAGQGVFTIVNEKELDDFMSKDFEYKKFIVQSLIGNYNWSSERGGKKLYHVGTIPTVKGETYVSDLRMMVISTPEGFKPISVYARRAELPLKDYISSGVDSWSILGTNLSVKLGENNWESETSRLMLMDRRDFNKLGLSLDDLIEAYIQTVLSTIAIDKMSQNLIGKNGKLKKRLFRSLNNDSTLINEIMNY